MSDSGDKPEFSQSGSRNYRHGRPNAYVPAGPPQALEQIPTENHLGKCLTVFHEIVSDTVHGDVHPVDPKPGFPFYRLVTSGMSDLPMIVPKGTGAPRYGELVMTLPESWKMTTEGFQDENWYWPVLLIKTLATLPHKYSTRLGLGHTVPNGDPPRPHAPTTELCCAVLVLPFSVSPQFQTLKISNEKEICFLAVMALYQDEMNLKMKAGLGTLLKKFSQGNMSDMVDLSRKSALQPRKRFWLF